MSKKKVVLFSRAACTYCGPVKESLQQLEAEGGVAIEYIDTDTPTGREQAVFLNVRSVPTVMNDTGDRKVGETTLNEFRKWLGVYA